MKIQKLLFSSILATGLAFNASCSNFYTSFPQNYNPMNSKQSATVDPCKVLFTMGNKSSLISIPQALCAATLFLGIPITYVLVSEKLEEKNPDLKDNKIYKSAMFSLLSLTYSLPQIIGNLEKRPFLFAAKCALISNLIFFSFDIVKHLEDTINEKLDRLY